MNNKPEMSRRRTQFNKARLGGLFHFVVQHMNDAAIAMLDVRAKNCEHNEPIQRAEGRIAEARLSKRLAKAYRLAIIALSE
jgi:hypothetical protein